MRRLYLPVFLVVCLCRPPCTQPLPMQNITVADGLSQGFITALYQDSRGFIWIGTLDGLNRYDGYSIRRFTNQPFNPFSLSNSAYITTIQEDAEGLLWVGTSENIYVFDPATERFFNLGLKTGVRTITMHEPGVVFIHAPDTEDRGGLFRILVPPGFSRQLRYGKDPLAGVKMDPLPLPPGMSAPVHLMPFIGDSMLLIRNWSGQAARWVDARSRFEPYDLLHIAIQDPADYSILWDRDKTGYIFRARLPDGRDTLVAPDGFRTLVRLSDQSRVTIVGLDNVLYKMARQEPVSPIFWNGFRGESPLFKPFLQVDYPISTVLVDRGDVIWAGTGGRGVQKINLRSLAFHHFLSNTSSYNLKMMQDGRIWIGKFRPYQLFNLTSGQLEPAFWKAHFNGGEIYNLLNDRAGNIWFSQEGKSTGETGHLVLWEKATGRFTNLAQVPWFKSMMAEQFQEDRAGNIWFAAHEGHLFKCRAAGPSVIHFNYSNVLSPHDKSLTSTAICEDGEGRIWIGTNRGLVEVQQTGPDGQPVFKAYRHDPANQQSLNRDWVLSICPDPSDPALLWIGTRGGGLNCLNKKTGIFTHWLEANGLPDLVVYGIVPDSQGDLWCSTNRGLSRFTPAMNRFINYLESDGLPNNEFNTGGYLRLPDGRLLFGGVNGLTLLAPHEVKLSNSLPPTVITGLRVRGSPIDPARSGSPLQFAPSFEQTLTLPFDQNNVTFEFAALDFANPATNRFRYRMTGLERDWINSGTAHTANYASLPPGNYVFEVQAATADGAWNPESARFDLVILPPWYRSWQAYLLYILTAAGIAWWYICFREKRLKERHALAFEQRESERLKELDSFKNRLFANITHEFRTPLTIILGLAERLRQGKRPEQVTVKAQNIIVQGTNLMDLVNQMLDLAKLDAQGMILEPVQANLSAFVRYQTESLRSLAVYKNLQLSVTTESPDLVMDFDLQRFRQILLNLLSNAIRHTPPGGSISVQLGRNGEDYAILSVSDTGEGIHPEDLPHIFDRFYQGRSAMHQAGPGGIGLALTRELVHLAGGAIRAESPLADGQGAVFTVILPIRNEAAPVSAVEITATLLPQSLSLSSPHSANPHLPLLLIVEDNTVIVDYLRLCLHGHYRLEFAPDGEKGIEKAFEHIPDLILSDVMMPIKDGFELAHVLKNDERTSHIPLVLLTARVQMEDRVLGRRSGADAYLTKPFSEQELLLVLQNLMTSRQHWKQRYAGYAGGPQPEIEEPEPEGLPSGAVQMEDEFMKKIYGILETHYADETFNLDQLCRLTGMSSSQLHRKLAALTDQPAIQMLRTYRLRKAHELLRTRPDLTVAEVAFMVGFKNAAHFSRVFSKTFGMPPSDVGKTL